MRVAPNKAFFWSVITAIIVMVLLSSCVTEKKRLKICQSCALKTVQKDSIIERLVEVPVYTAPIPGPTLYLPSPCAALCDSLGNLKPFTIEKKQNGIKTTVKSNTAANTLDISSNLEDSTKTTAKVPQKEIFHSEIKEVPARCQLRHLTDWDIIWIKVGKWLSGILLLLILFFFGRLAVKKYFYGLYPSK
jgi:hypothetical protein